MVLHCVYMLIDDKQCCFSFDKNSSVNMVNNKIRAFLQNLKHWMTCNFLKLNESKTKDIEILSNRNVESRIIFNILIDDSFSLPMPSDFVKTFGVIFDGRLNLEKHIIRVVSTCFANLRNLGRITSMLTNSLKVQLIHSLIIRGEVEDTRLEAKDTKKIRGQGQGQKQPFRGQALSRPRTGMLEAKAKDQGHRRKCSQKQVFKKVFLGISIL